MTRLFFYSFSFSSWRRYRCWPSVSSSRSLNPCLTLRFTGQLWLIERSAQFIFQEPFAFFSHASVSLFLFLIAMFSIWNACPNQVAEAVLRSPFCTSCMYSPQCRHAIGLCVRDRRAVAAVVAADGTRGLILHNKYTPFHFAIIQLATIKMIIIQQVLRVSSKCQGLSFLCFLF